MRKNSLRAKVTAAIAAAGLAVAVTACGSGNGSAEKTAEAEAQTEIVVTEEASGGTSGEQGTNAASAVSGEQAGDATSAVSGEQAADASSAVSNEQAGGASDGASGGQAPEATQTANPFTDYATLAEAEKAAGFEMLYMPETLFEKYVPTSYRAQTADIKMIEVIYRAQKEQGADGEIRIRKAVGSGDVSGDYNEYALTEKVDVAGPASGETVSVTMKGNSDDEVRYAAAWEEGGYAYAVTATDGIDRYALAKMIQMMYKYQGTEQ